MRSKIWPKIIRNVVKSQKNQSLYYEIDVVENDGDNRIRTGSTSNGVYAHARKEMEKTAVIVSDRQNFRLLLEVDVAESNGFVRIAAKHSASAYGEKTTKLCQIAKISVLIIGNQCR